MSYNLSPEKKTLVVSLLAEGSSIRAIERVTCVEKKTISKLAVRVGTACEDIMDAKMRRLKCTNIQVDEIWGFIGKKQKNASDLERLRATAGDIWTFISLDRDSKLIPSYLVGLRDKYSATMFMEDLAGRLENRIQLSTDGLSAYVDAVESGFGSEIDYAQIFKTYSVPAAQVEAARRYSPAEVVKIEKKPIVGLCRRDLISTSHVEKQNHTLRMHCRRLTRLTNAFSKKRQNFECAVALNFAYYNFCKRHIAVRMTPAQAAGVEASQWTIAELLERCGEI